MPDDTLISQAQRQRQHQRNTRVLLGDNLLFLLSRSNILNDIAPHPADSAREMLADISPDASSRADYAMVLQLLDDLALETAGRSPARLPCQFSLLLPVPLAPPPLPPSSCPFCSCTWLLLLTFCSC
eukprot:749445-Hanusia_phi.AAC.3